MMKGLKESEKSLAWVDGGSNPRGPSAPEGGDAPENVPKKPPKEKKAKAAPSMKKICQTKIQACNTKLTDLKCWLSKVDVAPLQLS